MMENTNKELKREAHAIIVKIHELGCYDRRNTHWLSGYFREYELLLARYYELDEKGGYGLYMIDDIGRDCLGCCFESKNTKKNIAFKERLYFSGQRKLTEALEIMINNLSKL